jgi:hypothetical protein
VGGSVSGAIDTGGAAGVGTTTTGPGSTGYSPGNREGRSTWPGGAGCSGATTPPLGAVGRAPGTRAGTICPEFELPAGTGPIDGALHDTVTSATATTADNATLRVSVVCDMICPYGDGKGGMAGSLPSEFT